MQNPLPTIRLTDDQLPEVKDWEVGKEYEIVLKVKQIAKKQGNEYGDMPLGGAGDDVKDKTITATFQVLSAETDEEEDEDETGAPDDETDLVGDYETDYANKRSKANK